MNQRYCFHRLHLLPCAFLSLALVACGSSGTEAAVEADFVDPGRTEDTLVRPPNVIAEDTEVILQIGTGGGSRLLPEIKRARIAREGSVRWLEIDLPIEDTWQIVRSFWLEEGFGIDVDLPEGGIIETDWQQDRSKVLGTGLSRYIDIALGTVNDTGIRHQFRSRVEKGDEEGTSNVFITHRSIEQGGIGTDGLFSPLPTDRILEVEMMRRLMLAFRLPEENIAALDQLVADDEVSDLYEIDGGNLVIFRSQDDAWRLLELALDRAGFTIRDKNRDSGRVVLVTADRRQEEKGFFSRWFDRGDNSPPREIELKVTVLANEQVQVAIPDDEQAESILNIVAANL